MLKVNCETDSKVDSIITKYEQANESIINQVVGRLSNGKLCRYKSSNSCKGGSLAAFATEAMYKFGNEISNSNITFAIHNTGGIRADILSSIVTYGDVYKAFPFDNELRIVFIKGSTIRRIDRNYNYVYNSMFFDSNEFDPNKFYGVITLDFLTTNSSNDLFSEDGGEHTFAYARDIVKEAFLNAPLGMIDVNNYAF